MLDIIVEKLSSLSHKSHHLQRYLKLIEIYTLKEPEGTFEIHHILPASIFPEYKNLKKNPWNSIKLTPRVHYLAHIILAKAFEGKMWYALRMMTQKSSPNTPRNHKFTSKFFELARNKTREDFSKNNPMKDPSISQRVSETKKSYYQSNVHHRKGAEHSENSKRKISEARLKTNGMKDKIWITDGKNNRIIDLAESIPNNWTKGFTDPSKGNTPSIVKIFNPFGFLIYECKDNFENFCIENELPLEALKKSIRSGKPISYKFEGKGSGKGKKYHFYHLWYAIRSQRKR